jgi:hypothetical protein
MRKICFFAALLLFLSCLAHAQSAMNTAPADGSGSASAQQLSPAQEEVWAAEESMHRYEQQRDAKGFLSLWDDNLVAWPDYEPRPVRKPKIEKDTVEEFQNPQNPGPLLPAPKPEAIGIFGDVAVTHYFWPEADQTSPTVYRATHTWQKGPQGWRIIGGMACEVPRPPSSGSVNIPVIPARPEDVSSPEAIVKASFESESGPAGAPRQWARERPLYDPNTVALAAGPEPGTGKLTPRRWVTFQQYADALDAYEVKTGFVDRPLACVTNKRAFVATVTCGYEASENGKVVERGVDIFQLYNDGKRWWILSVVWDKESPDNPIPPELLGKK